MNYLPKVDYASLIFWQKLAIEFGVVIVLLVLLRWISARVAAVQSGIAELSKQDNIAFGISIAGRMLALCIILSGAVMTSGNVGLLASGIHILVVGGVGIVLIFLGGWLHDRLILRQIKEQQQIGRRNSSVAIVGASAALSISIALNQAMLATQKSYWVIFGLMVASLITLLVLFYICTHLFRARSSVFGNFQQALSQDHLALSVSHAGKIIGAGFAVAASIPLFEFIQSELVLTFIVFAIVSLIIMLLLFAFVALAKWLILLGVDTDQEIELQHNIGIAAVETSLFIGFGLIMSHLLLV